jgi:hypothetical protein
MRLNLEKSNRNTVISKYLLIIILHVNKELSNQKTNIFRMVQKTKSNNLFSSRSIPYNQRNKNTKVKTWRKIYQACGNQKQVVIEFSCQKKLYQAKFRQKRFLRQYGNRVIPVFLLTGTPY